jgi:hypothetical protein
MFKYKYHLLILISLFVFAVTATAQDPNFTASVNNNPVSVGQQFQLSFRLEGSGKNFQPPSLNDFQVISGPNQGTSMQYINGSMTQSLTFSFILIAVKEGTVRIAPASIEVNGKKITSSPLNIIVKAGAGSQGGSAGTQGEDNIYKQLSDNIFLVASLNKTNVYKGEPVVVVYKLFTRLNLVNYGVSKVPPFTGFWAKEVSLPQQLQFSNESYNGIIFRTAEVKKTILFPQQTGTLTIEPMEAEVIARVQSKGRTNNPFDRFFSDPFFNDPFFSGWQDLKYSMKSQSLTVNVRELPSANMPVGFKGTVGKYNIETTIDNKEVLVNDPITLKVKISGRGNFDLIQQPDINFPPNMEVYDPKINDNINITGNGVSGSKTFEYLIIPRIPGEYVIDPLSFSYFDLDKKDYQVLTSNAIELKINKGTGQMTTVDPGSRVDFQMLGRDILFIKTSTPDFKTLNKTFFGSPGFYTLIGAPLLLFLGLLFYRKRQEEFAGDIVSAKKRGATAMARKRLAKAKQFMQQNKKEMFYEEIQKALWGYIGYKLSINVSELSRENTINELQQHNVDPANVDELINVIDRCEFARFAPAHEDAEMGNIYSGASEIITKIEQQIK